MPMTYGARRQKSMIDDRVSENSIPASISEESILSPEPVPDYMIIIPYSQPKVANHILSSSIGSSNPERNIPQS